jgi:hypothetical protein
MPAKWDRCVTKVSAKQSGWCRKNKYPRDELDPSGKKCYNPYAICSRLRSPSKSKSKSKRKSKRKSPQRRRKSPSKRKSPQRRRKSPRRK